ncbi:hypothetical protein HWE00_22930 [Raoultella terrigena]|nr:hypothetical protein [Raoultella terrigena]
MHFSTVLAKCGAVQNLSMPPGGGFLHIV